MKYCPIVLSLLTCFAVSPVGAQNCDQTCVNDLLLRVKKLEERPRDGLPTGTIVAYAGQGIPGGFLLANGDILPATAAENVALCTVIGDKYRNTSDQPGVCRLPDLSGRVPMGVNSEHALGQSFGQSSIAVAMENMPPHDHAMNFKIYSFKGNAAGLIGVNNSVVAGFPYVPNHSPNADEEVSNGRASVLTMNKEGGGKSIDISPRAVAIRYLIKR